MNGTVTNEQRIERLLKLMESHHCSPDDYDHEVEEDVREYVAGDTPCQRWVAVTEGNVSTYFYLFSDREIAEARAVEFVQDDLYAETPVEIYDLDEEKSYRPDWDGIEWKEGNE